MDKAELESLPSYSDVVQNRTMRWRRRRLLRFIATTLLIYVCCSAYKIMSNTSKPRNILSVDQLRDDLAYCEVLRRVPTDPSGAREYNKRWTNGTRPVLIRNATIWTGEPAAGTTPEDANAGKGYSWIRSDVLLDQGLIQKISPELDAAEIPSDCETFDAGGRQLTAGIVDMHSHAGLGSLANLESDDNELSSDITPFVKSMDGLNPLHPEIQWIKSGGVTASLILPGSGNNMGGEAFVVKLAVGKSSGRSEISQEDMLADPDKNWRYMKMACGENPKRVYGRVGEQGPFSRLGEAWEFRHALEQARNYVKSQDDWCIAASNVGVEKMATYLPRELRWESLGALLRGQVRLNTHCYTIPDLEAFVRHTNEFKFRLYAFHHAHQTYLVPEILKRSYGGTPAVALFADNMYYKVEAYTASERAGKTLYDAGITPLYVSDNSVLNAQHVVFEAAKGYSFGLPYHAALASVTSAPAELLGLGERIGKVKEGYDADIVVWDSDPLSVGAAPLQVWIDGAPQFEHPFQLDKPVTPPLVPDLKLSIEYGKEEFPGNLIITGISDIMLPGVEEAVSAKDTRPKSNVVISHGTIACIGNCADEISTAKPNGVALIHLENGHITPPFTAFGSSLGLVEIEAEGDTHNGPYLKTFSRAVDGLALEGKQLSTAYDHGVTRAISAPSQGSIGAHGISVGFLTGARNPAQKGAVFADEIAVHYTLTLEAKTESTPSMSSAIGTLRQKLLDATSTLANSTEDSVKDRFQESHYLHMVVNGTLSLVITVNSADTIASIIRMKHDIEGLISSLDSSGTKNLHIIILGGAESHLVAPELAASNISVVLAPLLPYAQTWDQRRVLTGAPLTNGTAIDVLLGAGVKVAIGVDEIWETRELGWMAGWAYKNGKGRLTRKGALDLVGGNIYDMLRLKLPEYEREWVVWEGDPLETGCRMRAVGSHGRVSIWG